MNTEPAKPVTSKVLYVLAWWREGLGGPIVLLTISMVAGIDATRNWHKGMKTGHLVATGSSDLGVWALPLLMLLSWSLHTLNDSTATSRNRRLARIAAPLLASAIAFCVWALIHFPFKFNP